MTEINDQIIKKIAKLARIEVSEDSYKNLTNQVSSVINWIEQLKEVDTEKVEVMTNVNNAKLVWNADIVEADDLSQEVLKNAKTKKYNYFAVPKVLE